MQANLAMPRILSRKYNRKPIIIGKKSTGYAYYLALTSIVIIWPYCIVIILRQSNE